MDFENDSNNNLVEGNAITLDNGLLHSQTHIHVPRGPSGSVSRVAGGTGGGTVGVGVGAI